MVFISIRDRNSFFGEALLFALGIGAQIERDLISERTKSGLRAALAKGRQIGRRPGVSKLDARAAEIRRYLAKGINKADIARLVDASRSTVFEWIRRNGGAA